MLAPTAPEASGARILEQMLDRLGRVLLFVPITPVGRA
jgi:hypothetical protein